MTWASGPCLPARAGAGRRRLLALAYWWWQLAGYAGHLWLAWGWWPLRVVLVAGMHLAETLLASYEALCP